MTINKIPTESYVDATRSILKIGGTVIDFIDWHNEYSGAYEAGTFRASINAPLDSWSWWSQQTEIVVDVYAGTPPDPLTYSASDLTHMMTVRCDQIELDPANQRVELSGRDLTGLLTDNKTTDKWPNSTASQIAALIAAKFNLQTNIQPTTGNVGSFYTTDHVKLARSDTYWNLLTYLAQRVGYQVFILGNTLYFGNFAAQFNTEPYLIQFQQSNTGYQSSNAEHLEFSRDLTISNDISVVVRSYHGYRNAAYTGTATATKVNKKIELSAELAQGIQHYDFIIPNLTKAECELKATELLKSISQHELKLEARLPFDTILYPWVNVLVEGTATVWDTTYTPKRVSRSFSKDHVSMEVRATAGIPVQTVTL